MFVVRESPGGRSREIELAILVVAGQPIPPTNGPNVHPPLDLRDLAEASSRIHAQIRSTWRPFEVTHASGSIRYSFVVRVHTTTDVTPVRHHVPGSPAWVEGPSYGGPTRTYFNVLKEGWERAAANTGLWSIHISGVEMPTRSS